MNAIVSQKTLSPARHEWRGDEFHTVQTLIPHNDHVEIYWDETMVVFEADKFQIKLDEIYASTMGRLVCQANLMALQVAVTNLLQYWRAQRLLLLEVESPFREKPSGGNIAILNGSPREFLERVRVL